MNVMKNCKKTVFFNNSLLDIESNMDALTRDKLIFYTNQCSERVTRIELKIANLIFKVNIEIKVKKYYVTLISEGKYNAW